MAHRTGQQPADFDLKRGNVAGQNRNLLLARKAEYRTLRNDLHSRRKCRRCDHLRIILDQWVVAKGLNPFADAHEQISAGVRRELETLRRNELALSRNPLDWYRRCQLYHCWNCFERIGPLVILNQFLIADGGLIFWQKEH